MKLRRKVNFGLCVCVCESCPHPAHCKHMVAVNHVGKPSERFMVIDAVTRHLCKANINLSWTGRLLGDEQTLTAAPEVD